MANSTPTEATLPWPALALLFLIPIVLGLVFQTDSSGNGDGAAYRESICYLETHGAIPLARLEWSHPGHVLTAWGLMHLLSPFGLDRDPHDALHILNFLALGILAVAVASTWRIYDRDRGRAFLAGLCVAILPGWLWCSQEPLSDVSGHSLVALCVCSLLVLQSRVSEGRALVRGAFVSAFLAGMAFLFRPSAGLFLPLFLWLGCEVLWKARGQRLRLTVAFLLGGLLPVGAMYTHLILTYGMSEFLTLHFPAAIHNMGFRGRSQAIALATQWLHNSHRGLGTYAFLPAGTGWLAWLLAGDWRPGRGDEEEVRGRRKRAVLRPFFLFALGLLPYFVFLLGNSAAARFRFSLPVQLAFVFGLVPLLGHLQRVRPGRWFGPYAGVFAAATIFHALPLLVLFATRKHFTEVGALEVTEIAQKTDLLLGHDTAPYIKLRQVYPGLLARGEVGVDQEPATTIGVRFDSREESWDFWNQGWRHVEGEILKSIDRGHRVLYVNELPLGAFRHWLGLRGFREHTIRSVPAETLRHRVDASLEMMDLNDARRLVDLRVLEVEGPGVRLDPSREGRLRIQAWTSPFMAYHLVAGRYTEGPGTEVSGIQLPLEPGESLATLAQGRLDVTGTAVQQVDRRTRPRGEAWIVVVLGPSGETAIARSRPFFAHPEDDLTPPGTPIWIPPLEETLLR